MQCYCTRHLPPPLSASVSIHTSCFTLLFCPSIPNHTADSSTAQACRSTLIRSSSRAASRGCQNPHAHKQANDHPARTRPTCLYILLSSLLLTRALLTRNLPFVRLDIIPDFVSRFNPAAWVLSPAGALSFLRLDLYLMLYLLDSPLISFSVCPNAIYPHLSGPGRQVILWPFSPFFSFTCTLPFSRFSCYCFPRCLPWTTTFAHVQYLVRGRAARRALYRAW
jgi:hypothetical protein